MQQARGGTKTGVDHTVGAMTLENSLRDQGRAGKLDEPGFSRLGSGVVADGSGWDVFKAVSLFYERGIGAREIQRAANEIDDEDVHAFIRR